MSLGDSRVKHGERTEYPKDFKLNAFISLAAGSFSGVICSILCAPLDVAKVRMQVQGSLGIQKYTTTYKTISMILKEEGMSGCFRGLGPTLCTVPLFWGIYWCTYDQMKGLLSNHFPKTSIHLNHIVAAITAGAIGDIITNPFWVVRTRIQTLALHKFKSNNIFSKVSTISMFRTIHKYEGFPAFYKGLSASFLGLSHVAIQFPLYEYIKSEAKSFRNNYDGQTNEIVQTLDIMFSSIAAKLVASLISYPHEVIRSRLQDYRGNYQLNSTPGLFKTVQEIIQKEGILSLWSGYRVNLVRIFPATISTFLSYEYLNQYLHDKLDTK